MANEPKFNPEALGLIPSYSTAGNAEQGDLVSTLGGWSKDNGDGTFDAYSPEGIKTHDHTKYSSWLDLAGKGAETMIKTAAPAVLPMFLPGINAFIGGATGLTGTGLAAATGALTGGGMAALTGGDPLRGALMGGLGGAAFNALGQYLPQQGFTDAQIAQNAGYGAFNNDAADSMLALENANAGYGAFNNDALDTRLAQEAGTRIFENSNRGYGADNIDVVNNGALTQATDNSTSQETSRDLRGYDGEEIGGVGDHTSKTFPDGTQSVDTQKSLFDKAVDSLKGKFIDPKTGDLDWSKTLAAAGLVVSTVGKLTGSSPTGASPVGDLINQVRPPGFDAPLTSSGGGGALSSWQDRARIYAADMQSPVRPGARGYAGGGEVEGALTAAAPFVGFVQGQGGGQDDLIEASLSAGEYVFDAETVSMLGDGNNEEGARKLDELRQSLRAHKRSAPDDEIAPPAQGALSYMNGGQ